MNLEQNFDCNNGKYMILGRILEVMTFEEILNNKILFPLRMKNSGMLSHYKQIKNLVPLYCKDKTLDHLIPNIPILAAPHLYIIKKIRRVI